MSYYSVRKIESQVIDSVIGKLKAADTDKSVKSQITDIYDNPTRDSSEIPTKRASIDVIIEDIDFFIEGMEATSATMFIELWCNDVTAKDGKIVKCEGGSRFCWDERDHIWDFYTLKDGKKQLLQNYNENGMGLSGDQVLAENVSKVILEKLSKAELDDIMLKLIHKAV